MQVRYECKAHGKSNSACCEAAKRIETIAHDDPTALCTREGQKRYRRWVGMLQRGQINLAQFAQEYPPLVYEDNRQSGRLATTSKANLERMK